jgi:hypothetical protein
MRGVVICSTRASRRAENVAFSEIEIVNEQISSD